MVQQGFFGRREFTQRLAHVGGSRCGLRVRDRVLELQDVLAGTRIESAGGVTVVQGKIGDVDSFLVSGSKVRWRKAFDSNSRKIIDRREQFERTACGPCFVKMVSFSRSPNLIRHFVFCLLDNCTEAQ
jgi:hypothetical protein